MNIDEGQVELSIIIASYNSERTIEKCLLSLGSQETSGNFEVIVVDSSSGEGVADIISKKFPEVKLYRFPQRKFVGDARNFGISKARGRIIAFTDADCEVSANWANEIIKSHDYPYLAIGGAIANGNPNSNIGWAAYFCEFNRWMPNTNGRWFADVAGASMSYKKDIFEKYGGFIEGTYCSDTEFHWRMKKDGYRIRFISSILVFHNNIEKLGEFLRHEYNHGRSFAKVRVKSEHFSGLRKFVYAASFMPILAKLFVVIVFRNLRNRIYLAQFIKSLHLFILGLVFWSLGECTGYASSMQVKGFSGNVGLEVGR